MVEKGKKESFSLFLEKNHTFTAPNSSIFALAHVQGGFKEILKCGSTGTSLWAVIAFKNKSPRSLDFCCHYCLETTGAKTCSRTCPVEKSDIILTPG